jgi:hypothetical protein
MNRREFCEFIATVAGAGALSSNALAAIPLDSEASWPASANYPNNRAPLRQSRYVKLPLGSGRPSGWLLAQLTVQKGGRDWRDARAFLWIHLLGPCATAAPRPRSGGLSVQSHYL